MNIENTQNIVNAETVGETSHPRGDLGDLVRQHYGFEKATTSEITDVEVVSEIIRVSEPEQITEPVAVDMTEPADIDASLPMGDINAMLNQKLAEKGIDPNAVVADNGEVEKKPEITVKIAGNSYFYPPGSVFIGVGVIQKRYESWLDRLVKETFDNLTLTTKENGDYHPKYVKAYRLIQSLIYMANAEDEHENVIYAYEGPRLTKDLDIAAAVSKLVKAKKDVLKALTPYYLPEHAKPVEKKSAVEVDSKSTADEAVEV